jgi:hypothetical protein
MVRASEFAAVIAVMAREGNTLEAVLRDAWDRANLAVMTRNSPLTATGALISIAAHCTIEELRSSVDRMRLVNGFLNRFLLVAVKRARLLPFGGRADVAKLQRIGAQLDEAIKAARTLSAVEMAPPARDLWTTIYPELTADRGEGVVTALSARAEAQVVRLALLYALADQQQEIEVPHLEAALEVWRYCEDSARLIFLVALLAIWLPTAC